MANSKPERHKQPGVLQCNHGGEKIAAFVSIPKNASKSVLDILELGANRDHDDTTSLVIYENHQRAAVLARKYNLAELFVFCFARNPYSRCISWYQYHRKHEFYRSMSFDQWIKAGMPHHWQVQNETNYQRANLSPLLQYTFVEEYKIDFIGQIETFDRDLKIIIYRLNELYADRGINHRFCHATRWLNSSFSSQQGAYFTAETKGIVRELLARDFEFFGYEP